MTDQAATLVLFDGVLLIGVRALGVPVTRDEAHAVMHLWKYVGCSWAPTRLGSSTTSASVNG